jgi:hypothetical protein
MGYVRKITNNLKSSVKEILFRKLVRKEVVVVKDVATNLLKGKHAFVTGGNSGIGFSIAKKMVECGAEVTIVGSNEEKTKQAAEKIHSDYLLLDLLNTQEMLEKTSMYLKTHRIDILVNSAGMRDKEPWLSTTPDGYDCVMKLNLKAPYFLSQLFANYMLEHGVRGHILNVSSSSSVRPGWGPYQLSKRAMNGMTLGFGHRLAANGITVNGIAPGVTLTPMVADVLEPGSLTYPNPMRRAESPEELANLAVFLCSDLGNSVIGDTVMMTGGSGNLSIDF